MSFMPFRRSETHHPPVTPPLNFADEHTKQIVQWLVSGDPKMSPNYWPLVPWAVKTVAIAVSFLAVSLRPDVPMWEVGIFLFPVAWWSLSTNKGYEEYVNAYRDRCIYEMSVLNTRALETSMNHDTNHNMIQDDTAMDVGMPSYLNRVGMHHSIHIPQEIQHGSPTFIEKIKKQYDTIVDRILPDSDCTECPICMDEFSPNSQVCQLECGHMLHDKCLWKLLYGEVITACPLCRGDIHPGNFDIPNCSHIIERLTSFGNDHNPKLVLAGNELYGAYLELSSKSHPQLSNINVYWLEPELFNILYPQPPEKLPSSSCYIHGDDVCMLPPSLMELSTLNGDFVEILKFFVGLQQQRSENGQENDSLGTAVLLPQRPTQFVLRDFEDDNQLPVL